MPRRRKYKRVNKVVRRSIEVKEKLTDDEVIDNYYNLHREKIVANMPADYVNQVFGGNYREAYRDVIKEQMKFKKPGTNYTKVVDGEEVKVPARHYTVKEAINRANRSKVMNPDWHAYNRGEANLVEGLKTSKEARNKIISLMSDEKKIKYKRRQRKDRRRKQEITYLKGGFDNSKMKFIGTYNLKGTNTSVYIYDDEVAILISKSPQKGTGANFDIRTAKQWEDVKNLKTTTPINEIER